MRLYYGEGFVFRHVPANLQEYDGTPTIQLNCLVWAATGEMAAIGWYEQAAHTLGSRHFTHFDVSRLKDVYLASLVEVPLVPPTFTGGYLTLPSWVGIPAAQALPTSFNKRHLLGTMMGHMVKVFEEEVKANHILADTAIEP